MSRTIVIIGGGIAATTCLESLLHGFDPDRPSYQHVILISASRLIRRATNYTTRGRNLELFDVEEIDLKSFLDPIKPEGLKVSFVNGFARQVDSTNRTIIVNCDASREVIYHYENLVICIGSSPSNLIVTGSDDPDVQQRLITIRDTSSVGTLQRKLSSSRSVALIGNGGISLELINKISNCKKVWIVRDKIIGRPFLDSGASKFILDSFGNNRQLGNHEREAHYKPSEFKLSEALGPALGPYWLQQHDLTGALDGENELEIIYQNELSRISASSHHDGHKLTLVLSSGKQIECDLVISAIGVAPNKIMMTGENLKLSAADGAIIIDDQMRTSVRDIYAAGDVASCENWPSNPLWFQMRLWTQARQMGYYCGQCIISHRNQSNPAIYFNFECFTHCTNFLGKKIVLLGRYNIQDEDLVETSELEILIRKTNVDYVKLIVKDKRIIGAILVGQSGLDETVENLILDQMDIGAIKHHLLDETVDIEDYFD